jgi:hypothetical protein
MTKTLTEDDFRSLGQLGLVPVKGGKQAAERLERLLAARPPERACLGLALDPSADGRP